MYGRRYVRILNGLYKVLGSRGLLLGSLPEPFDMLGPPSQRGMAAADELQSHLGSKLRIAYCKSPRGCQHDLIAKPVYSFMWIYIYMYLYIYIYVM